MDDVGEDMWRTEINYSGIKFWVKKRVHKDSFFIVGYQLLDAHFLFQIGINCV